MLLNNIYANILVKVKLGISQFQLQSSPQANPLGIWLFWNILVKFPTMYVGGKHSQMPHYVGRKQSI